MLAAIIDKKKCVAPLLRHRHRYRERKKERERRREKERKERHRDREGGKDLRKENGRYTCI